MPLIESLAELKQLVVPILEGRVQRVAFDTETTEILEKRFTPFGGSPSRICGFSISYNLERREIDLYAPIRHRPYDWRRSVQLMCRDVTNEGARWARILQDEEGITEEGTWRHGDPNLELEPTLDLLRRLLSVGGVQWMAHNWPFDARMLLADGVENLPWDRMDDTKDWSVFTDERPLDEWDAAAKKYAHGGHSLKHIGEVHLGVPADDERKLEQARKAMGVGGAQLWDYSMLPLRTVVAPYACMDTRLVLKAAAHMEKRPAWQVPEIRALIDKHRMERPLSVAMERRGISVDKELALERAQSAEDRVARLSVRANQITGPGQVLPLGNPKALEEVLYVRLGIETYRGMRDTRKPTLKQVRRQLTTGRMGDEKLSSGLKVEDAAELVDIILDHRAATKELTAFYRPLTHFGETGRVHTVLSPVGAVTTRYISEKPNVMQTKKPKKGKTPEETLANQKASIRAIFKPEPGHAFLCFDYDTQELRQAAHFALAIPKSFSYRFSWGCTLAKRGDCKGRAPHGPRDNAEECRKTIHLGRYTDYSARPAQMELVEGFMSGDKSFDPHAAMVRMCHARGLTFIDRDVAKTADFAILYGAGSKTLSETLDCPMGTAGDLISIFWDRAYPELGRVKLLVQERLRQALAQGEDPVSTRAGMKYIRTMHGARIHLAGAHKAFSHLVQRSCREILLNATLGVDSFLRSAGAEMYRMVLPLHDELIFEVPEQEIDQAMVRGIAKCMVKAGGASLVPHVVEPQIARASWAEKESMPEGWGYNGVLEVEEV